jgi:ureidoacrylate peracid hydrolase|tara:strand:- start:1406 stop:1993 length:588 start_codon:yes stop_codon:yes gene_type:complete
MKTALIIVDLQNDFLHADGAYARGGLSNPAAAILPSRLRPLVNHVKACGGLVVASQFTLWPDTDGEPMVSPHLKQLRPFLRRGDFAPGSWGQACVDALRGDVDVSVQKVAYSAFYQTQLEWLLRKVDVGRVIVSGIVTNGGVASTVRDAHMRDFETCVLSDGSAAFTLDRHETALADMASVCTVATVEAMCQAVL